MGEDWNQSEVEAIVADYFDMLRDELLGVSFSKAEHRKALLPRLRGRTNGSVEYKHQNLSAVLYQRALPYIDGYKPSGNYQRLLAEAVDDYLERHPDLLDGLAATSPKLNPTRLPQLGRGILADVIVPPPPTILSPKQPVEPWVSKRGHHVDFAQRDAQNRKMGALGEEFVLEVERQRLGECGRSDLAAKVEWSARRHGDGLGYDVRSFDPATDAELYIEVKTTGLGEFFPFYISQNEVRCSKALAPHYRLYRVFDFSKDPHLYILPGDISVACRLEAIQYRATR